MAPPDKRKGSSVFKKKKKATKKPVRRDPPVLESKRQAMKHGDAKLDPYAPPVRKKKKKKKSKKRKKPSVFDGAFFRIFSARRFIVFGFSALAIFYVVVSLTLPDISNLNTFHKTPSILVKTEDGNIVGSIGDIYGQYVTYDEFPKSLVDAVVATEDRNYFSHFGIDPIGLTRAMYVNIKAGHVVQGGSTITQQVAKNVFLTPERSFARKLKEMVLALQLEWHYSKKDILSIYLNRVYLGAGNFGVAAASRRYFDKPAYELSLSESAIIAGLLKAPSRYAPTRSPEAARKRAQVVLSNMRAAGYLTVDQMERAKQDLRKRMRSHKRSAQSSYYFIDWVIDQLPDHVGDIRQDIEVTTTLRTDMQQMAEKALTSVLDAEGGKLKAGQAALVSVAPDGAIRAMVGGRDYGKSQYNRATQAQRQPGSSFKPIVYLAGLEAGLRPDSVVEDKPVSIKVAGGKWRPRNYSHRYDGVMLLRDAVRRSINTVAVQVAMHAGLDRVVRMARRLGISSEIDQLPSIALGSVEVSLLDMTTAYAHLASDGSIVEPYGITKIRNRDGDVLYQRDTVISGQVLNVRFVNMMHEMLRSVITHGTGKAARIKHEAAGKTGTTSDYRDAWFMGYTKNLVTGVWVGNDDNSPMLKVTGGSLPARIWKGYMDPATEQYDAVPLIQQSGEAPTQLPWRRDAVKPARGADGDRLELGPEFWNKLFR